MKLSGQLIYITIFLALVLLLGLGLLNPPLLFTLLIEPITRIFWLILRTVLMVDQMVYWMLLVLAGVIVGFRLIPERQENPYRVSYLNSTWTEDRVRYWETMIRSAEDDPKARRALQLEFEILNQSVLGLIEENEAKNIKLPAVKQSLRLVKQIFGKPASLFRWIPHQVKDQELERQMDLILSAMEIILEKNNDSNTDQSSNH